MTRFWRRQASHILPSERGFLELASEEGLPLREVALRFRALVSSDMDWADSRKARYRRRAGLIKVASLSFAAISTVILGVPNIPNRAAWALPFVALITLLNGIEAYYNWRLIWLLMEATQYQLNRLRDEMDYYLVTTAPDKIRTADIDKFFREQQRIWADVSRRWVGFRKTDAPEVLTSPPIAPHNS